MSRAEYAECAEEFCGTLAEKIFSFEEFAEENRLGDFMIRNTPRQDAAHSFPWPSVSGFRASVPGTEKVLCCTPPSRSRHYAPSVP